MYDQIDIIRVYVVENTKDEIWNRKNNIVLWLIKELDLNSQ